MTAPYTGRCNCEEITVHVTAEPVAVRQCWCRKCQKIAAGGSVQNAMFPADAVTITGTWAQNDYVAASGNTITHAFCPTCGVDLFSQAQARPQFRTLRLGLLDEGHGLRPQVAIWTQEAPDWALIDPGLEQFERQPPLPATTPAATPAANRS